MIGPDTKYMMQWMGEWRPVVNMFGASREEVYSPMLARTVVLAVNNFWVAALIVNPSDIVERTGRNPNSVAWEFID